MNKYILSFFLLALLTQSSLAQNGKILDRKAFTPPASLIKDLNEDNSGANYADTFSTATMERIVYASNKLKVVAYVIQPVKPGKYPIIIYNRDGYGDKGLINELFCATDLHEMARWGYVVIASQYRGYEGEEGKDEFGGEDVQDVLNLFPMAANLEKADTSRIGMYGFNRGGMMTYQCMARTTKIDAAISESGISNFYLYAAVHAHEGFENALGEMIPNFLANKSTAMRSRSMAYWTEDLLAKTPLLMMHGTSDWEVHPSESSAASDALFRILYPHRLIMYEGGTNGLPEFKEEKTAEIKKWFDRYVRDQRKAPEVKNLERR